METNKNIAIVGSRNFTNSNVFNTVINEVISIEGSPKNIISGGAIGADTLAYEWAIKNGISVIVFEPKYKDFPKKVRKWMAPKERNTTIVNNSDTILAFWDMESTGTKDTMTKALENGKKVYLFNIKENKLTLYTDEVI
jgi:predicted Rossmann fold nucleotide-binding protein DprA/Smf involved in DNA uptake